MTKIIHWRVPWTVRSSALRPCNLQALKTFYPKPCYPEHGTRLQSRMVAGATQDDAMMGSFAIPPAQQVRNRFGGGIRKKCPLLGQSYRVAGVRRAGFGQGGVVVHHFLFLPHKSKNNNYTRGTVVMGKDWFRLLHHTIFAKSLRKAPSE